MNDSEHENCGEQKLKSWVGPSYPRGWARYSYKQGFCKLLGRRLWWGKAHPSSTYSYPCQSDLAGAWASAHPNQVSHLLSRLWRSMDFTWTSAIKSCWNFRFLQDVNVGEASFLLPYHRVSMQIHLFIHSFSGFVLSVCWVPESVLSFENESEVQNHVLCPLRDVIIWGGLTQLHQHPSSIALGPRDFCVLVCTWPS